VANLLKMTVVQSILSLHSQGWSNRRIALALLINRRTVGRYVRQHQAAGSKCTSAPIEPARLVADSKCTTAPTGPAPPIGLAPSDPSGTGAARSSPTSRCATWRDFILARREQGLTAKRSHQDLLAEPGTEQISYDSVRRFLKRLGVKRPVPFRRMECEPGQEAQVDFGKGARVLTAEGKRRKTHVLRVVLSHSRKAYSESCFRQTSEDFLRVLENAFWHFGGVPKTLVVDNLKAAVLRADWFDPELNPKLQSFAQHYGTVILPTRPRTPRHKGKVERGVGYVQDNGLKGHEFASLEAQNRHLVHWEETVADTRIHGTTKRQVGKLFREAERAALAPLPRERFPFFHEAQRIVSRDGHIEVAKAYYSAPPEYLGRTVWARWDARLVRLFNHRLEQIAVHLRREPGKFSTLGEHLVPEKISGVERGAVWLLNKIQILGEQAQAWSQAMLKARGIAGVRVLQGLLALSKRHSCEALDQACATALSYSAFQLRTIRQLLKHRAPAQQPLPLLDEHPIIRPLSDYGSWVRAALAVPRGRNQQDPQVPSPPTASRRGPPHPPSPLL
jgi:transposase